MGRARLPPSCAARCGTTARPEGRGSSLEGEAPVEPAELEVEDLREIFRPLIGGDAEPAGLFDQIMVLMGQAEPADAPVA